MTEPSRLRKRPLEADAATIARAADEIDIAGCATIAYSSEDPAHPVEDLFDGRSGPGATRWMSARPNTLEHIVVEFDKPQTITRLVYEVEEAMRERTRNTRSSLGGWRWNLSANFGSGIQLQPQRSHVSARRTAL
jgi:hypothetical protein